MRPLFIKAIALIGVLCTFGIAGYLIFSAEEAKRAAQKKKEMDDYAAKVSEVANTRETYYAAVEKRRAEYQKDMKAAQENYNTLLSKQPAAIDAQKTTEQVPVTKTVPIQQPAPKAKTKSS